jgi:hypothetical protein
MKQEFKPLKRNIRGGGGQKMKIPDLREDGMEARFKTL